MRTRTARLGCAALVSLAATAAHAQLDYSAYGTLDFSIGRFQPSGFVTDDRFNSNSLSASFVGVQASYGFDGGWKPGITLETFLRFQDWDYGRNDDDPFLSRNAFVSLDSNYGRLRAGRMQSDLFVTTTRFNAFGNSPAFSPALRHIFLSGGIEGVQGDFYWDRAVSYTTPRFDFGLQGQVMYSGGQGKQRGNYVGSSLVFSRGVYAVSLVAQRVRFDNGIDDAVDETAFQLGASYNFGLARAFGEYTRVRDRGELDATSNIYTAGVSVPVWQGNVLAQGAYSTSRGPALRRRHTTFSLGYVYQYDSTLDFYLLGIEDRVRNQTRGLSYALGVRYQF